jgi:hypothetical protein
MDCLNYFCNVFGCSGCVDVFFVHKWFVINVFEEISMLVHISDESIGAL